MKKVCIYVYNNVVQISVKILKKVVPTQSKGLIGISAVIDSTAGIAFVKPKIE